MEKIISGIDNILSVIIMVMIMFASNTVADAKVSKSTNSGGDHIELDSLNSQKRNLIWYWEDSFTDAEKLKTEEWVNQVFDGNCNTLGSYPFDIYMHIFMRANSKEPVPWANTWRYPKQSLYFYIDPVFPLDSFLSDWTAPHEFSHLTIPYLGEANAWFAEGYASFMQYQIMRNMGIYTEREIEKKYAEKIESVKTVYQSDDDMITIARDLRKNKQYRQMYWGGASYFILLDNILKKKYSTSLCNVIIEYQKCCRLSGRTLENLMTYWDEIIGTPEASILLEDFEKLPAREIIERTEQLSIFR